MNTVKEGMKYGFGVTFGVCAAYAVIFYAACKVIDSLPPKTETEDKKEDE